jgi:hypothetical protein
MNTTMRMTMLATSATVLLAIPGCDPGADEREDALDEIVFRCNVLGGCDDDGGSGTFTNGKGNTSFLGQIGGEGVYPLNELPLDGAPAGPITLLHVRASRCVSPVAGDHVGAFITAPQPALSVGPKGELLPLTVHEVGDPSFVCEVSGSQWSNTVWTIAYDDGVTSFQTELRLTAISLTADDHGAPLYEFQVDATSVPDPRFRLQPTCDEAPEEDGLRFAAYLVPGLAVQEGTGHFTSNPNRATVACLSSSIGKAWRWGYKSFLTTIGTEGHEVAHNAIRAEYCGDDVTYTAPNTMVWFQSVFTEEGPDPHAPPVGSTWALEAVWPSDPQAPAICVGQTRRPEHQPAGNDPFACPGTNATPAFDLPRCTPQHLVHEDAIMATWAQP